MAHNIHAKQIILASAFFIKFVCCAENNYTTTAILNATHTLRMLTNISIPRTYERNYTFRNRHWFKPEATPPFTLHTGYLINPIDICPKNKGIDHLIVVKSATHHVSRRMQIRDHSWHVNFSGKRSQRLVFLLGTTPNKTIANEIEKEAKEHGDILQGPFLDTYHNLTLKGVMGLKWITEFCPNVKYVVKTDDDCFVSPEQLSSDILPKFQFAKKTFGCLIRSKGVDIKRDPEEKWFVDKSEFVGEDTYPFDYCPGFFVVMTGDVIREMLAAARVVPFFWIDDVYLYGLLRVTVGDDVMPIMDFKYEELDKWLRQIN